MAFSYNATFHKKPNISYTIRLYRTFPRVVRVRCCHFEQKSLENAKFSRLFLCLLPMQILRADDCFSSALYLFNYSINWNLLFLLIFQNIPCITFEHLTDCRKGGKADSRDLVIFDLGEINVGDSYALGKLVQRDFSFHHHSIKSKYYLSHSVTS